MTDLIHELIYLPPAAALTGVALVVWRLLYRKAGAQ